MEVECAWLNIRSTPAQSLPAVAYLNTISKKIKYEQVIKPKQSHTGIEQEHNAEACFAVKTRKLVQITLARFRWIGRIHAWISGRSGVGVQITTVIVT